MVPPDSVPLAVWQALHASTNLAADSLQGGRPYPRNLIYLMFRSTATQAQRQVAVDLVSGTVIGGASIGPGERYYLIQIQDNGTSGPLGAAIDTLKTLSQVYLVHAEINDSPLFRKPNDGVNWLDWKLNPDSADSLNWGLERIQAPDAWGCSVGASTTTTYVLDTDFRSVSDLTPNVATGSNPMYGQRPDSISPGHGTQMASIIGAVAM
jgi:hypothetical protein